MSYEDLMRAIDLVRFTQVVEDPYPEETEIARNENLRFFRYAWNHIFKDKKEKKEISLWQAHREGYLKAYEEIKRDLPKKLGLVQLGGQIQGPDRLLTEVEHMQESPGQFLDQT